MAKRIKAIERRIDGLSVYQRENDGCVNATQICKVHRELTGERKDPANWLATNTAQRAIEKLSTVTGIPVTEIADVRQRGKYQLSTPFW